MWVEVGSKVWVEVCCERCECIKVGFKRCELRWGVKGVTGGGLWKVGVKVGCNVRAMSSLVPRLFSPPVFYCLQYTEGTLHIQMTPATGAEGRRSWVAGPHWWGGRQGWFSPTFDLCWLTMMNPQQCMAIRCWSFCTIFTLAPMMTEAFSWNISSSWYQRTIFCLCRSQLRSYNFEHSQMHQSTVTGQMDPELIHSDWLYPCFRILPMELFFHWANKSISFSYTYKSRLGIQRGIELLSFAVILSSPPELYSS